MTTKSECFFAVTAEKIYIDYADDLTKLVIIVPNYAIGNAISENLISLMPNRASWMPKIITFSDYINLLSPLQEISNLQSATILYELYYQKNKTYKIAEILDFFLKLLDEVTCLELSGVVINEISSEQFLENCYMTLPDFKNNYAQLKQKLLDNNVGTRGMIYKSVYLEENNVLKNRLIENFAFINFSGFLKLEEDIIKKFKICGSFIEFFWDHNHDFVYENWNNSGDIIKKYSEDSFWQIYKNKTNNELTTKFNAIQLNSITQQTEYIAQDYNEITTDNHIENKSAIVLKDSSLIKNIISSLNCDISLLNINIQIEIKESATYEFFAAAMKFYNNYKNISKEILDIKSFLSLFSQRLIPQKFFKFILQTFANKPSSFTTIAELQDNEWQDIFKICNFTDLLHSNLLKYLTNIIKIIIPYAESHIDSKFELHALWEIENFLKLLNNNPNITNIEDSEFLSALIINQLRGDYSLSINNKEAKIDIVSFDTLLYKKYFKLYLLDFCDGIYPKECSKFTIFLKKEIKELEQYNQIKKSSESYNFFHKLKNAQRVDLIYCEQKHEVSRYLLQLNLRDEQKIIEPKTKSINFEICDVKSIIIKTSIDEIISATSRISKEGENEILLSSTFLRTYLECKLKFYFRYIKKISEPKLFSKLSLEKRLGLDFHELLAFAYNNLIYNSNTNKIRIDDLEKFMQKSNSITESFFYEKYEKNLPNGTQIESDIIIIKEILKISLYKTLKFDFQRAPIEIFGLEKDFKLTLPKEIIHNSKIDNFKVSLIGRIDRVDKKDCINYIFDYKTGIVNNKFSDLESLFKTDSERLNSTIFQLLLYSYAHYNSTIEKQEEFIPQVLGIRSLHEDTPDSYLYKKEGKKYKKIESFAQLNKNYEENLALLINNIYKDNNYFEQTKNTKICENCIYKKICKR